MTRISRRQAGKLLVVGGLGSLSVSRRGLGATMINSVIRGVQLGAQSYSFRDRPLDGCIAAFQTVGLGECELYEGHAAPPGMKGAELRRWRLTAPLSFFSDIRTKFDHAGILLYAFNYSFRKDFTDEEIEKGLQFTQAMGLKYITASSNVSVAPRVDVYAKKYKIMVGFHGHDKTSDPDEFSTPETFARALKGASPYLGINLDIGHFVAAGGDPVAFLKEHHAKIVTIHLKDRKKDHGANLPFGEGDTPIVAVLQLIRDRKWKFPANIEYEYGKPGMDSVVEVKKCFDYCKKALES